MIDSKKNLVAELSKEFWLDVKSARETGKVATLKKLYYISEGFDESYAKRKKKQREYLDSINHSNKKEEMAKWEKQYNLRSGSKEAWLNAKNEYYLTPSETAYNEYTTAEYKNLTPLQKEFHSWYRDKNKEFSKLLDKKYAYNFTPSIRRSMIDKLVEAKSGNEVASALLSQPREFLESLSVQEEMEGFNNENKVPIYFMRKVLSKEREAELKQKIQELEEIEGKTESQKELLENYNKELASSLKVEDKSTDLLQSMLIFGNMAYRASYMNEIKGYMQSLRYILANKPQYLSDYKGNIKKDIEGNPIEDRGNTRYLEYFDAMTMYYLYGKKTDAKDVIFKAFGKDISSLKIFNTIHSYLSRKALAGNLLSATAGSMSAMANAYMYGKKGQYYTNDQFKKALKLYTKNPISFFKAMEYFKIDDDNWSQREAAKLQDNWFKRNLVSSNWYLVQRIGENQQVHTTALAMLQQYGIDDNGKMKKITLLPEGSQSLWELSGLDTGEIDFSKIPKEVFHEFRNYAQHVTSRIKGSVSDNNRSEAEGKLWAQAVMKFRTWIPGLLRERFQGVAYEPMTKEFELGRYRVVTNSLFDLWKVKQEELQGNLLEYATTVGLSLFREDSRIKMTEAILDKVYENYKRKNPDNPLFQAVENGEIAEYEAKQKVLELFQGQLRAAATELKIIMAAASLMFMLGYDYDDDGEADYKKFFITRWSKSFVDRMFNELTFFVSPRSTEEILRSPIPILALMSDFQNFGGNTLDEWRDVIIGENKKSDRTGFFYYSKSMIPLLRYPIGLLEDIEKDYEDEGLKKRKTPKKGTRGFDIN